jgi:hypothetical protein
MLRSRSAAKAKQAWIFSGVRDLLSRATGHSTAWLKRVKLGIMSIPLGISVCLRRNVVAKKKAKTSGEGGRPKRRKLSAEESLQRMKEFDKRKEAFIAALRKSKNARD